MDPCNVKELLPRLSRAGFQFSRSMGQNFVIERWVPATLADASGCDANWAVLEVGPGAGALTKELAERAGRVLAVELDERIIPVLSETVAGHSGVSIIKGDALQLDLDELFREKAAGLRRMVAANLPYNITAPVLEKLVYCGLFERLTVMIQLEVAEKLLSRPGDSQWCLFAAKIRYKAHTELIAQVPPECFYPAPKVTSAIVRLDLRPAPGAAPRDEEFFQKVLAAAFHLRRKTLINSLAACLPFSKAELNDAVTAAGIEPSVRGESLTLAQLAVLSDRLLEIKHGQ